MTDNKNDKIGNTRKNLKYVAAAVGFACVSSPAAIAADITIGMPNWPSVKATAHVLKVVIEENLGLEVELQNGNNPVIFEAMDTGKMAAHPEVWIPNQQNLHDTFVKDKGSVAMNQNGVPSEQGMCATKPARDKGVKSIDDLSDPDVAAMFDTNGDGQGELWIGGTGWASTNVEKIRAKSYGYDQTFELLEADESVAWAGLDSASKANRPWVGYCYSPHYVFIEYDIEMLDEPKYDPAKWNVLQPTDDAAWLEKSDAAVAWDTAWLHLHYSKSVEDTHPEVATLFRNMKLEPENLGEFIHALAVGNEDPEQYAKKWVSENEDTVLSWLSE